MIQSKAQISTAPGRSSRSLENALFSNICRGEELRGNIISLLSMVAIGVFLPASYYFEARFDAVFGREIPRMGITQILLFTAVYGFLASKFFGDRRNLSLWRFQVARYVNATVDAVLPSIILIGVTEIVNGPEALASPPIFLYFMFIILSALRFDLGLAIYTGVVSGLGYLVVAAWFVPGAWVSGSGNVLQEPLTHYEKAGLMVVAGFLMGIVTVQLRKLVFNVWNSHQEQSRIKTLFGQHVSDVVMEKLLSTTNSDDIREVVVLFFDIRNFTAFSENKEPAEVVSFLNALFEELVAVGGENNGFVNKFLGDGFMAVFGAPLYDPDAAEHAVQSATELLTRLKTLNEENRITPTQVSMGIHVGAALTGTVGTEQRKEYTVIGDAVNTAARVEALNRSYGSTLLVTQAVVNAAPRACAGARRLGAVKVRGKEEEVTVFKLA